MVSGARINDYYRLTKPGIVYGNIIATLAGFFLASSLVSRLDPTLLIATILGTSLVIGSSCVVNNYIDRGIDLLMKRTQLRALVSGAISSRAALIYAFILATFGFGILILWVNVLTALAGLTGYIVYVIIYGYAKRHTPYSTLIGSVAGAIPPLAGYVAVTNRVDTAAIVLFLILTVWQMPHFYAIAIRRKDEYKAAGLPVLPVVRGDRVTRTRMMWYIALYLVSVPLLTVFSYTGYVYLMLSVSIGLYWLFVATKNWKLPHELWAKKVFFASLFVLLGQCVVISVGALLP